MKAHLLFADQDLDLDAAEPAHAGDLMADLELDTLLAAMAGGDDSIRAVARAVLLQPLTDPAAIGYRQAALADCLRHQDEVRALFDLAAAAIAAERKVLRGLFRDRPEMVLHRSVQVLELFLTTLRDLRRMSVELAPTFRSEAFTRFFAMVSAELDDDYLAEVDVHLKALKSGGGELISSGLGHGGEPVDLVLLRPKPSSRSLFNRIGLRKPNFSYAVPDRDEAGSRALAALRDQALNDVANAAGQSCDHVLGFFRALQSELAFYLGCLNLHRRLGAAGRGISFPVTVPAEQQTWSTEDLYDVCLCLRTTAPIVGNTVDADGASLVMVTGANRGGKSTFLRSVGLAALMTGAGMFVGARQLRAATRTGVFTHFIREEDEGMSSGKFDEELARMSALARDIRPHSLVLCNESFQATNELEGSEIGRQVIRALTDAGVTVVFVTHLYDLAQSLYAPETRGDRLFLRAERDVGGERTFRVVPGEPLPTSYGVDLYDRMFPTF